MRFKIECIFQLIQGCSKFGGWVINRQKVANKIIRTNTIKYIFNFYIVVFFIFLIPIISPLNLQIHPLGY